MKTQTIAHALFTTLTCACLPFVSLPAAQAQTQAEMNQTAGRNADKADAAMNIAYKKLMAALDPAQKTSLKKAQQAWLVFRDADAAFDASQVTGGSMYPMVYENSVQEITEARTKELKAFLKEVLQESGGR